MSFPKIADKFREKKEQKFRENFCIPHEKSNVNKKKSPYNINLNIQYARAWNASKR